MFGTQEFSTEKGFAFLEHFLPLCCPHARFSEGRVLRRVLHTPSILFHSLCSKPLPHFLPMWQYLGELLEKCLSTEDSWMVEVISSWDSGKVAYGRIFLRLHKALRNEYQMMILRKINKGSTQRICCETNWPQLNTERGNWLHAMVMVMISHMVHVGEATILSFYSQILSLINRTFLVTFCTFFYLHTLIGPK